MSPNFPAPINSPLGSSSSTESTRQTRPRSSETQGPCTLSPPPPPRQAWQAARGEDGVTPEPDPLGPCTASPRLSGNGCGLASKRAKAWDGQRSSCQKAPPGTASPQPWSQDDCCFQNEGGEKNPKPKARSQCVYVKSDFKYQRLVAILSKCALQYGLKEPPAGCQEFGGGRLTDSFCQGWELGEGHRRKRPRVPKRGFMAPGRWVLPQSGSGEAVWERGAGNLEAWPGPQQAVS